jgi:hypothetical protein
MDFPLVGPPPAMPASGLVFAGVADIEFALIGGGPDLSAPHQIGGLGVGTISGLVIQTPARKTLPVLLAGVMVTRL